MHKALAVKYDSRYPAPFVLVKGRGEAAERIVRIAKEHGVPVEKRDSLAETLYEIDIGELVPEEFYRVLAELLVFVGWIDDDLGD